MSFTHAQSKVSVQLFFQGTVWEVRCVRLLLKASSQILSFPHFMIGSNKSDYILDRSLRMLGPTYMVRNLEIPFRVTREILNMSLLYRFINRGACLPDSHSVLLSTRPSWKWLPGLKASRLNGDNQSGYFQIRILIRRQYIRARPKGFVKLPLQLISWSSF